jgi:hypothetical protein
MLAGVLGLSSCAAAAAGSGQALGTSQSTSSKPSPSPSTPPPGTCPGARTTTHASARKVILRHSPDHVPFNRARSGPQSLPVLIHETYRNIKGAADFLVNVGYQTGYQVSWTKGVDERPGRVAEFTIIYQFTGSAGACSFAAWESKNVGLKRVAGLPGLTGHTEFLAPLHAYSTEFAAVKGQYVVLTGAVIYGPKNNAKAARKIMLSQYARL